MQWKSAKLRQYLLGDVSEEVRAEFDLQLLSNSEFIVALEVAEEELIDDYLDGLLTSNELIGFQQFFLSSTERMNQIEFSKQLKHHLGEVNPQKKEETTGYIDWLRNFFRPTFVIPGIVILLVVVIGLSYYILHNRSVKDPDSRDSELAQLNQRDLSNLSEFTDLSRLTLVAETTRGLSEVKILSLKQLSDPVLLRLSLPATMSRENVRVRVTANNGVEAKLENAKVYSNPGGQDVRVLLPRSKLAVGTYAVEITESSVATDGATYRFQIEP